MNNLLQFNTRKTEIEYEGQHLFTGEIIERMKIHLPLLQSGLGAVSYYVRQLETVCRVRGLHSVLAPLLETYFEEILFEKKTTLFDQALVSRLGDSDVGEYIRAVFIPLIRKKTTTVMIQIKKNQNTKRTRQTTQKKK